MFYPQILQAFVCGTEESVERLIVMLDENEQQALWDAERAQELSFCIQNRFGDVRDKLEKGLREAAKDWMLHANVDFQLRDDLSCEANSNVFFPIRVAPRRARYAARAFFPNYAPEKRLIRVKKKYIQNATAQDVKRLMLHELGHVLGFRHEQIHPENGNLCPELGGGFEPITEYDPLSVMHYARCKPDYVKNYVLSEKDKEGARKAYPFLSE